VLSMRAPSGRTGVTMADMRIYGENAIKEATRKLEIDPKRAWATLPGDPLVMLREDRRQSRLDGRLR